ncbi:MAG: GMC oxidoreductase, partial [Alphaproteobacteria bacterium]|nr:GMC oxidoreductase [Alphaproteobacteria bacterium]
DAMVEGFKIMRSIIEAAPMDRYRGEELAPGTSVRSDDEIENFLREKAETGFHPVSTCRMGPGPGAVVDDQLRVHGMQALRVADASIFPTMPSGNTNAPAIMVGERAADLIKAAG